MKIYLELGIVLSEDQFIFFDEETSEYAYEENELMGKIGETNPDYFHKILPWSIAIRKLPDSERALIGAKYLIAGANSEIFTEDSTAFEYFINCGFQRLIHLSVLRKIVTDESKSSSLISADIFALFLKKNNIDIFSPEKLEIKEKHASPLEHCITQCSPKILEILFDYDCQAIKSRLADVDQQKLIRLAVEKLRPKWIKFLLENGASVGEGIPLLRLLLKSINEDDILVNLSRPRDLFLFHDLKNAKNQDLKTAKIARMILDRVPSILTNNDIFLLVGQATQKGYIYLSKVILEKLEADRDNL